MAAQTKAALRFTLSGPGIDKSYETAGVALSAAITAAERYGSESAFYVRDVDGTVAGRVERDQDGRVTIGRASFIGAGR
jgi:hypothetical protein